MGVGPLTVGGPGFHNRGPTASTNPKVAAAMSVTIDQGRISTALPMSLSWKTAWSGKVWTVG